MGAIRSGQFAGQESAARKVSSPSSFSPLVWLGFCYIHTSHPLQISSVLCMYLLHKCMYLLHNFLADNVKQFFKCPRNTVYFTIITALENFLSEQLGNSPLVPRTNILSNEYNICT